jgi:hypothetical protein
VARDLVGVPFFSTSTSYNVGQPVNYQGQLYTANVSIVAGPWNPLQWALISAVKKNYIINGAMLISQQNSTTASALSAYYCADQWTNFTVATPGAWSTMLLATSTPGGSPNRIEFRVTAAKAALAASDQALFTTGLEGYRVADLKWGTAAAQPITIRFGCNGTAGTYCVTVMNGAATNRCYVSEFTIASGEANTDVVKSVTIPGDTTGTWLKDNSLSIYIFWCLATGSTYQTPAGVWTAANKYGSATQSNLFAAVNNYFDLFDVGMYVGTTAPSYVLPDYQQELAACQRYWFTLPITVRTYAASIGSICQWPYTYPVTMRATPTFSMLGGSASNVQAGTLTSPSNAQGGTVGFTSAAAGDAYYYGASMTGSARMF